MPFFLSRYSERTVFQVGDSKTDGAEAWKTELLALLNARGSSAYFLHADVDYQDGGATVATMKAIFDGSFAGVTGDADIVTVNLGSNDLSSLPDETTLKNNYRSMIEAMGAKWSNVKIYLAKPVRLDDAPPSTPVADMAALHGWIDDLVGEYAYVYSGIDETALEGGDSYATNLVDVTHYTAPGQTAVSALWNAIV